MKERMKYLLGVILGFLIFVVMGLCVAVWVFVESAR